MKGDRAGYPAGVIFCALGVIPFLLLGIMTLTNGHWIVGAWCTAVVIAFADWGRRLVLEKRGGGEARSFGAKGASYRAVTLAVLSVIAAVILPDYLAVREKVKFNRVVRWLNAVDDGEYYAFVDHGKYSEAALAAGDPLKPVEDFSIEVALSTGASVTWTAAVRRKPERLGGCPIFDCYTATYRSLPAAKRRDVNNSLSGSFTCNNQHCAEGIIP